MNQSSTAMATHLSKRLLDLHSGWNRMHRNLIATLLFAFISLAAAAQDAAVLTIDTAKQIAKVSPTLYGIMTEEINYSYDGGLYAELVSNRTFQTNPHSPDNWLTLRDGNARASMQIDKSTGPSAALPSSLKLTVQQADAEN